MALTAHGCLLRALTLDQRREMAAFERADADPSVRSCLSHRSLARDLRLLEPSAGMLSVVLQPAFREVASSLSTHELMTMELLRRPRTQHP